MKKYILLAAAGAIISLSACTSNTTTGGMTKEQQDSAVNARAADSAAKMKAGNDSMINATAKMRADSTMRADSMMKAQGAKKEGAAAGRTGTHIVKETTKQNPQQPATIGNGKPAMGDGKPTNAKSNGTTIGNGKPKMGG